MTRPIWSTLLSFAAISAQSGEIVRFPSLADALRFHFFSPTSSLINPEHGEFHALQPMNQHVITVIGTEWR